MNCVFALVHNHDDIDRNQFDYWKYYKPYTEKRKFKLITFQQSISRGGAKIFCQGRLSPPKNCTTSTKRKIFLKNVKVKNFPGWAQPSSGWAGPTPALPGAAIMHTNDLIPFLPSSGLETGYKKVARVFLGPAQPDSTLAQPDPARAQEIFPLLSFYSNIEFEDHCGNN